MKVSTEVSLPKVLLSSLMVALTLTAGWIGRQDISEAYASSPPQAAHPSVTVTIVSASGGDTIPARCSITDVFGSDRYPPAGFSFYHDVEEGYFYTTGAFSVEVPEGNTIFRAGRGFEYVPTVVTVPIASDTSIVIRLEKVCDPLAMGIFSGDVHLHLNHGPGYYTLDPSDAKMIAMGEGLSVMNCLDNEYFFTGGPDECSDGECVVYMTEERRSGVWGHYALLGLERLIGPYGNDWGQLLGEVADSVHTQEGALVVCSHPVSSDDFFDITDWPGSGIARLMPIDAALGRIDAFEVMSYSNAGNGIATDCWYDLLNCGFRIAAVGGTDALIHQVGQYPAGGFRTWVYTGEPQLSFDRWTEGIRDGRTFVSNGPLFTRFDVFGLQPGEGLSVVKGEYLFPLKITLLSAFPVDRVEIVRNGRVVKRLFPSTDPCGIDTLVNIRVNESSWIAARAFGGNDNWFTRGDSLFAHTSPFYVEMEGMRIVEEDAAGRFARWMEDLLAIVRARDDWGSPQDSIRADNYVSAGAEYYRVLAGSVVAAREPRTSGEGRLGMTCYPNPFNASLSIVVGGAEDAGRAGATAPAATVDRGGVFLTVYDVSGRKVRDLSSDLILSGSGTVSWDGRDEAGRTVASGVYFLRLTAGQSECVKKIVLLR